MHYMTIYIYICMYILVCVYIYNMHTYTYIYIIHTCFLSPHGPLLLYAATGVSKEMNSEKEKRPYLYIYVCGISTIKYIEILTI